MKESFLSEPEYTDKDDIVTLILRNNVSKMKMLFLKNYEGDRKDFWQTE